MWFSRIRMIVIFRWDKPYFPFPMKAKYKFQPTLYYGKTAHFMEMTIKKRPKAFICQ